MIDDPVLDKRNSEEIVRQAVALASRYVPEWNAREGDPGMALIRLFSRLMEIVIARLNRVPEKNFLAFLDTAGITPHPPTPARAPVKFFPVAGPNEAFVPLGTQLATTPVAGEQPVTFETETGLTVSLSGLTYAFTLDYAADKYSNYTDVVTADDRTIAFAPFVGEALIPHVLCLSQDTLFAVNHPTQWRLVFEVVNPSDDYKTFLAEKFCWYVLNSDNRIYLTLNQNEPPKVVGNRITLSFNSIEHTENTLVDNEPGFWLFAETKEKLQPEQASLSVTSIGISAKARSILPVTAFSNDLPVDITKDFFPFGATPRLLDTFSFAVPEAFSKSGARVTIAADAIKGVTANGIALQFEFWDGKRWSVLGVTTHQGVVNEAQGVYKFLDFTKAFTADGLTLYDRSTEAAAPTGKETLKFTALADNVSIIADNATSGSGNKFRITVTCNTDTLDYDELTVEDIENKINGISPYVRVKNLASPSPAPTNRPKTSISQKVPYPRIEFTCPKIEKQSVNGKENYWIRIRIISGNYGDEGKMEKTGAGNTLGDWTYKPADFKPPVFASLPVSYDYDVFQEPTGCFSYNNFCYLPGEKTFMPFDISTDPGPAFYMGFDKPFANDAVCLFITVKESTMDRKPVVVWEYWNGDGWKNLGILDETGSLTTSGTITFIGPTDFMQTKIFGSECCWLRVRRESSDKSNIRILGIYTNTIWAKQCTTIREEIIGSSTETPNAIFTCSHFPVLEGQKIEVREPEKPADDELERLIAEEGTDAATQAATDQTESGEYWVRWHPVEQFRISGEKDRHYVIDRMTGSVMFGDGKRGMIPPAGRDNIRALCYEAGGGEKGNVKKGTINVLKRAVPFIDSIINIDNAGGGSDGETNDRIKISGPQTIKHRDLAVTCEDYEWLAKAASLQIARAKCLSGNDPSGTVRLILIPGSDEPKPTLSQGLIRQVEDYLKPRRISTADLVIEGPQYVDIAVRASVCPLRIEEADPVRERVKRNLQNYFHPLDGGQDNKGWEFGRDVYVSEICKVIEDTEGVDHAEDVVIIPGLDHVDVGENYVVASGEHVIDIIYGS
jgi:hypothetical protein